MLQAIVSLITLARRESVGSDKNVRMRTVVDPTCHRPLPRLSQWREFAKKKKDPPGSCCFGVALCGPHLRDPRPKRTSPPPPRSTTGGQLRSCARQSPGNKSLAQSIRFAEVRA